MADLRALAERLLTLAAYKALIDGEYKKLRTQLGEEYTQLGIKSQGLTLPDGMNLGSINLAEPAVTVTVTDEDAMLAWLDTHHPTEIITKHTIRPSYWRILETAARKAGVGVDPDTGQRLDWIRVDTSEPVLRVTGSLEAKRRVRDIVQQAGLMELET